MAEGKPAGQGQTVRGRVDKVIYASPNSLFTVVSLAADDGTTGEVVVVGPLGRLNKGEVLTCRGQWKDHPSYGRRFEVSDFRLEQPRGDKAVTGYLGSGLIKGLGPALAGRIVARFGDQTMEVLHNQPERLAEVQGIGPQKLAAIKKALAERREVEGLGLFLKSHDLPVSLALRLHERYGAAALAQVRADPYRLVRDIHGIGFKKADDIAARLGFAPDSPQRVEAGLIQALRDAADDGHVFLPYRGLIDQTAKALAVDQELIKAGLARLLEARELVIEDINEDLDDFQADRKAVFLAPLYRAERRTAVGLSAILHRPGRLSPQRVRAAMAKLDQRLGLALSDDQRAALAACLQGKVSVITGGPGTGKTTMIQALVNLFVLLGLEPALAAPTGRAAKRLAQAAGRPAQTLHRLLEYHPSVGFKRHGGNRLPQRAIIVDEASMIDISLMAALVAAVDSESWLVLVGDVDQLPAVGPGRVLGDLIDSGQVGVARLTHVFRQAAESRIVANAHLIRRGKPPNLNDAEDFYFIHQPDPERAGRIILELAAARMPQRFGLDPLTDIQVLAPMIRGVCGVESLNNRLQEALNPHGQAVAGDRFRKGDKVIQTRNNYDLEVFNGDAGVILAEPRPGRLLVDLDGEVKEYGPENSGELAPAYCLSVHKAQGSEYPAVILPLLGEHYIMLTRNLVYTALTRARRLAVLVGDRARLASAVRRQPTARRLTLLSRRLREGWG